MNCRIGLREVESGAFVDIKCVEFNYKTLAPTLLLILNK